MAKAQTTEVATVKTGALVAGDFMDAADFGAGFEGTDKDSFAIPFLQILQKMSPIADEDSPKYIQGLKPGMLFNTVTQKPYDVRNKPLTIVPCFFKRSFICWGSRDEGGGFKGEVSPLTMDEIIARGEVENVDGKLLVKDKDGEVDAKKSDYWSDTRALYVIVVDPDDGEFSPAILSLASTQIKASKMLMTTLQNRKVQVGERKLTPPLYANVVNVSTVAESNDKGNWSGIKFDLQGLAGKELFDAAKSFYQAVHSGAASADYSKAPDAGDNVSSGPSDADKF